MVGFQKQARCDPDRVSASFTPVPLDPGQPRQPSALVWEDQRGRNAVGEADPECFCEDRVGREPPVGEVETRPGRSPRRIQRGWGGPHRAEEKPSLEEKVHRESVYSVKPDPRVC